MERKLALKLTVNDGRVSALDVQLPRFQATTLLGQRPAQEAVALLPSVFSICAQAQAAATAGAVAAALGQSLSSTQIAAHTLAVKIESVQESLRSLCLSLPETLLPRQSAEGAALIADFSRAWRDGTAFLAKLQKTLHHEISDAEFAALMKEAKPLAQMWDQFGARHVFGVSALRWQGEANETSSIVRWFRLMESEAPTLGRTALSPLPLAMFRAGKLSWSALVQSPYDASAWRRVQQDERMAPVATRLGNSAAARLWARLVDVATTLAGLLETGAVKETPWIRLHSLGEGKSEGKSDGDGMAEVECARGVLVHRARLAGTNIAAYELCAPTDWNLHRDGALATLIGVEAKDIARLQTHATWLVQMLDPCVAFEIEVSHA